MHEHPQHPPHPVKPLPPVFSDSSGWSYATASKLGGLQSKGVEVTRAELHSKNYPKLADAIPLYFQPRFWIGAVAQGNYAKPDSSWFQPPADTKGLTFDQLNQLLANVAYATNKGFVTQVSGGGGDTVGNIYRGEFGVSGFAPVVPGTSQVNFSPAPIYDQTVEPAFPNTYVPGWITHEFADAPNYQEPTSPDARMDHMPMDVFWDGSTDANLTRYVRSWAIAQGAKIELELPQ